MNTQMERHQEASHSAGLRSAGVAREGGVHDHVHHHHHHDEGEQNEKKSVLKKVKAKAKKIKDTITKHGHHDDHAHAYEDVHGRPHVDLEDEDDDDEDEELEEGPEVHGAPMYESKEVRSHVPGRQVAESKEVQSHVPGLVAELKEVRRYAPGQVAESKEVRSHVPGQAAMVGSLRHDSADVNPQGKHDKLSDYRSFIPEQVGVSKHDVGVTFGGSQSTHPLPPHDQTNLPHLTSGTKPQSHLSHTQECPGHELSDYSSSFIPDHVGVSKTHPVGGPQTEPASPTLGYTITGVHEDTNFPLRSGLGISALKTGRPTCLDSDPRLGDAQPDNYQTKVKDPTARGGQEIGATPILHSLDKMAIFDDKTEQRNAKTNTRQQESLFRPNAAGTDHHSLSSGGHEQYCGTGSHDQFSTKPVSYETSSFPVNQEDDETLSPDHDIGITGLSVSSATSLIADKAIQAKNVVASKLGYGGEADHQKTNVPFHEGEVGAGKTSSVAEYGKKVASTVYNKVAGVGGAEHGTEGVIYDKGVSTKEYIAEKVTPREEDKALSDVISGALHKDTGHEGEDEKKAEPRGKVTISAKVARQLGTEGRSEEEKGSGKSGPRGAVVETLRDTVTSWLGIGGETGPSYVVYHDLPKEANEGMSGHNQQGQGQGTLGEPRIK